MNKLSWEFLTIQKKRDLYKYSPIKILFVGIDRHFKVKLI
jgi:hypothetical protein